MRVCWGLFAAPIDRLQRRFRFETPGVNPTQKRNKTEPTIVETQTLTGRTMVEPQAQGG